MRQMTSFLGILLSLFLISSCHHFDESYEEHHQYEDSHTKKSCCGKKQGWHKEKKCCKGKRHFFKWKKRKSCCGKGESVAGFSKIQDLNKGKISGSIFFERAGRYEVKITAAVKGLAPSKKFGFHIHEFGTCANKGLLAGGHLNPWGAKHSGPQDENRHLGDLGNLESDKQGTADYSVSVKGRLNQFMGRSVIIHAQADDMETQPTGNSGERIACGVITASMPPVQEEETPVGEQAKKTVEEKETDTQAVSVKKAPAPVQKAVSSSVEKAAAKKPADETAVSTNKKADIQTAGSVSEKAKK